MDIDSFPEYSNLLRESQHFQAGHWHDINFTQRHLEPSQGRKGTLAELWRLQGSPRHHRNIGQTHKSRRLFRTADRLVDLLEKLLIKQEVAPERIPSSN